MQFNTDQLEIAQKFSELKRRYQIKPSDLRFDLNFEDANKVSVSYSSNGDRHGGQKAIEVNGKISKLTNMFSLGFNDDGEIKNIRTRDLLDKLDHALELAPRLIDGRG